MEKIDRKSVGKNAGVNKSVRKAAYGIAGVYFEAVGRRKTSVARVHVFESKSNGPSIMVNDKPYQNYFSTPELKRIAENSLTRLNLENRFKVIVKILGGGIHSQAEALRHGIARAIIKVDLSHRKPLKSMGFLKRDPRMKERRKFGLKKARKAPQWAKR